MRIIWLNLFAFFAIYYPLKSNEFITFGQIKELQRYVHNYKNKTMEEDKLLKDFIRSIPETCFNNKENKITVNEKKLIIYFNSKYQQKNELVKILEEYYEKSIEEIFGNKNGKGRNYCEAINAIARIWIRTVGESLSESGNFGAVEEDLADKLGKGKTVIAKLQSVLKEYNEKKIKNSIKNDALKDAITDIEKETKLQAKSGIFQKLRDFSKVYEETIEGKFLKYCDANDYVKKYLANYKKKDLNTAFILNKIKTQIIIDFRIMQFLLKSSSENNGSLKKEISDADWSSLTEKIVKKIKELSLKTDSLDKLKSELLAVKREIIVPKKLEYLYKTYTKSKHIETFSVLDNFLQDILNLKGRVFQLSGHSLYVVPTQLYYSQADNKTIFKLALIIENGKDKKKIRKILTVPFNEELTICNVNIKKKISKMFQEKLGSYSSMISNADELKRFFQIEKTVPLKFSYKGNGELYYILWDNEIRISNDMKSQISDYIEIKFKKHLDKIYNDIKYLLAGFEISREKINKLITSKKLKFIGDEIILKIRLNEILEIKRLKNAHISVKYSLSSNEVKIVRDGISKKILEYLFFEQIPFLEIIEEKEGEDYPYLIGLCDNGVLIGKLGRAKIDNGRLVFTPSSSTFELNFNNGFTLSSKARVKFIDNSLILENVEVNHFYPLEMYSSNILNLKISNDNGQFKIQPMPNEKPYYIDSLKKELMGLGLINRKINIEKVYFNSEGLHLFFNNEELNEEFGVINRDWFKDKNLIKNILRILDKNADRSLKNKIKKFFDKPEKVQKEIEAYLTVTFNENEKSCEIFFKDKIGPVYPTKITLKKEDEKNIKCIVDDSYSNRVRSWIGEKIPNFNKDKVVTNYDIQKGCLKVKYGPVELNLFLDGRVKHNLADIWGNYHERKRKEIEEKIRKRLGDIGSVELVAERINNWINLRKDVLKLNGEIETLTNQFGNIVGGRFDVKMAGVLVKGVKIEIHPNEKISFREIEIDHLENSVSTFLKKRISFAEIVIDSILANENSIMIKGMVDFDKTNKLPLPLIQPFTLILDSTGLKISGKKDLVKEIKLGLFRKLEERFGKKFIEYSGLKIWIEDVDLDKSSVNGKLEINKDLNIEIEFSLSIDSKGKLEFIITDKLEEIVRGIGNSLYKRIFDKIGFKLDKFSIDIDKIEIQKTLRGIPNGFSLTLTAKLGELLTLTSPVIMIDKKGVRFQDISKQSLEIQINNSRIPVGLLNLNVDRVILSTNKLDIHGKLAPVDTSAQKIVMIDGLFSLSLSNPGKFLITGDLKAFDSYSLGNVKGDIDIPNKKIDVKFDLGGALSDIFNYEAELLVDARSKSIKISSNGNLKIFKKEVGKVNFTLNDKGLVNSSNYDLGLGQLNTTISTDYKLSKPEIKGNGTLKIGGYELSSVNLYASPWLAEFNFKVLFINAGLSLPSLNTLSPNKVKELILKLLAPDIANLHKAVEAILSGNFKINPFSSFGKAGKGSSSGADDGKSEGQESRTGSKGEKGSKVNQDRQRGAVIKGMGSYDKLRMYAENNDIDDIDRESIKRNKRIKESERKDNEQVLEEITTGETTYLLPKGEWLLNFESNRIIIKVSNVYAKAGRKPIDIIEFKIDSRFDEKGRPKKNYIILDFSIKKYFILFKEQELFFYWAQRNGVVRCNIIPISKEIFSTEDFNKRNFKNSKVIRYSFNKLYKALCDGYKVNKIELIENDTLVIYGKDKKYVNICIRKDTEGISTKFIYSDIRLKSSFIDVLMKSYNKSKYNDIYLLHYLGMRFSLCNGDLKLWNKLNKKWEIQNKIKYLEFHSKRKINKFDNSELLLLAKLINKVEIDDEYIMFKISPNLPIIGKKKNDKKCCIYGNVIPNNSFRNQMDFFKLRAARGLYNEVINNSIEIVFNDLRRMELDKHSKLIKNDVKYKQYYCSIQEVVNQYLMKVGMPSDYREDFVKILLLNSFGRHNANSNLTLKMITKAYCNTNEARGESAIKRVYAHNFYELSGQKILTLRVLKYCTNFKYRDIKVFVEEGRCAILTKGKLKIWNGKVFVEKWTGIDNEITKHEKCFRLFLRDAFKQKKFVKQNIQVLEKQKGFYLHEKRNNYDKYTAYLSDNKNARKVIIECPGGRLNDSIKHIGKLRGNGSFFRFIIDKEGARYLCTSDSIYGVDNKKRYVLTIPNSCSYELVKLFIEENSENFKKINNIKEHHRTGSLIASQANCSKIYYHGRNCISRIVLTKGESVKSESLDGIVGSLIKCLSKLEMEEKVSIEIERHKFNNYYYFFIDREHLFIQNKDNEFTNYGKVFKPRKNVELFIDYVRNNLKDYFFEKADLLDNPCMQILKSKNNYWILLDYSNSIVKKVDIDGYEENEAIKKGLTSFVSSKSEKLPNKLTLFQYTNEKSKTLSSVYIYSENNIYRYKIIDRSVKLIGALGEKISSFTHELINVLEKNKINEFSIKEISDSNNDVRRDFLLLRDSSENLRTFLLYRKGGRYCSAPIMFSGVEENEKSKLVSKLLKSELRLNKKTVVIGCYSNNGRRRIYSYINSELILEYDGSLWKKRYDFKAIPVEYIPITVRSLFRHGTNKVPQFRYNEDKEFCQYKYKGGPTVIIYDKKNPRYLDISNSNLFKETKSVDRLLSDGEKLKVILDSKYFRNEDIKLITIYDSYFIIKGEELLSIYKQNLNSITDGFKLKDRFYDSIKAFLFDLVSIFSGRKVISIDKLDYIDQIGLTAKFHNDNGFHRVYPNSKKLKLIKIKGFNATSKLHKTIVGKILSANREAGAKYRLWNNQIVLKNIGRINEVWAYKKDEDLKSIGKLPVNREFFYNEIFEDLIYADRFVKIDEASSHDDSIVVSIIDGKAIKHKLYIRVNEKIKKQTFAYSKLEDLRNSGNLFRKFIGLQHSPLILWRIPEKLVFCVDNKGEVFSFNSNEPRSLGKLYKRQAAYNNEKLIIQRCLSIICESLVEKDVIKKGQVLCRYSSHEDKILYLNTKEKNDCAVTINKSGQKFYQGVMIPKQLHKNPSLLYYYLHFLKGYETASGFNRDVSYFRKKSKGTRYKHFIKKRGALHYFKRNVLRRIVEKGFNKVKKIHPMFWQKGVDILCSNGFKVVRSPLNNRRLAISNEGFSLKNSSSYRYCLNDVLHTKSINSLYKHLEPYLRENIRRIRNRESILSIGQRITDYAFDILLFLSREREIWGDIQKNIFYSDKKKEFADFLTN